MTESIIDICETLISLPDSTSIPNIELYFVWLFHEDITLPSSFAASLLETNQADTTSTAGVSHLIDSKSEKKGDQFHWIWRSESPLEDTDVDEFIEPRSISFCTRAYCRRLACRYEQESSQNEIDARMDRLYHIHKSIIYGDCLLDHRDDWNDDKWTSKDPDSNTSPIQCSNLQITCRLICSRSSSCRFKHSDIYRLRQG